MEATAIRAFEDLTGLTVTTCGLFIGTEEEYFLAASPDGLIEDDNNFTIEVKCSCKEN